MSSNEPNVKVQCLVCNEKGVSNSNHHYLAAHLNEQHSMSLPDYLNKYGERSPIASTAVWETLRKESPERKGSKRYDNIIKVGGIQLERRQGNPKQPFARPDQYMYPKKGKASKSVERIARAVKYGRTIFVYGPAGSGKSAVLRALGHDLNLECSHYPMREGLDPELYLGKEAVVIDEETSQNVTRFIKGKFLKDLEGRVGLDGVRRGVLMLIDDIDRAPAEYHEILRHVIEDNAQNVFIPELAISIDVHPDTIVVATANSAGRGDMTGYYSSVQEMDESILDRFQRVVQFHFLEKEEEKKILKNKFPSLAMACPHEFDEIMEVAETIREMIRSNEIFASFSHRRLVQWMQSAEELLKENKGKHYPKMMSEAATDWLEWYDVETRETVKRAVSIHLGDN